MSIESAAYGHADAFRWRQGDPTITEVEAKLHDLAALRCAVEEVVGITVDDARADGVIWARIGDALGVNDRVAQGRYGGGRR